MASNKYPYEHRGFLFTTLLLMAAIALMLIILVQYISDLWVLAISVGLLVVAILAFGISPLLTAHSLDEDRLVIRQGIFFNGKVPLDNISNVERLERVRKRSGVFFALNEPTLYVTTRSVDLVAVHLIRPQRFNSVFGKRVETIIIDSTENDRLISDIRKIIPASPDQRS